METANGELDSWVAALFAPAVAAKNTVPTGAFLLGTRWK